MDAADGALAVMPDVVEDDERPVRPAGEDRLFEPQLPHGRVDVAGPQAGVGVAIAAGLVREAVAPHVHRGESVVVGQLRIQLPAPREPALREPVDEQDRSPLGIAGLDEVEPYAPAPSIE